MPQYIMNRYSIEIIIFDDHVLNISDATIRAYDNFCTHKILEVDRYRHTLKDILYALRFQCPSFEVNNIFVQVPEKGQFALREYIRLYGNEWPIII